MTAPADVVPGMDTWVEVELHGGPMDGETAYVLAGDPDPAPR
ncbi:hypothetical protein ACFVUN_34795 [Kitasatospora griseola]